MNNQPAEVKISPSILAQITLGDVELPKEIPEEIIEAPPGKDPEVQTVPKILTVTEPFYIRSVLYGPTGAGKTSLAATAPRPFFWMVDPEGWLSIIHSGHLWWEVKELDDMRRAWDWAVKNLDQFDTLVVDTLTHLQNIGMDELVDSSVLSLERKTYGRSSRQMRSVIMGLTTFPKDILFICNERLRDNQITRLKVSVPDLTPSVNNLLMDVVRLVGRLTVTRVLENGVPQYVRTLQVASDGRSTAKDTRGVLPYEITDPNLTEIFTYMREGQIEKAKESQTKDSKEIPNGV